MYHYLYYFKFYLFNLIILKIEENVIIIFKTFKKKKYIVKLFSINFTIRYTYPVNFLSI